MIKYCEQCYKNKENACPTGYMYFIRDEIHTCIYCHSQLLDIDFPREDLKTILEVSETKPFVEAMIELRNKDIIEYEMKMSQFRTQVVQQQEAKRQQEEKSKPHCPHCHSTNIAPIGTGERIGSIAVFGVFSKKINKSFKCKKCGYTW